MSQRLHPDVRQARKKHNKRQEGTKSDSHKSNKRHKPDKRQPLLKRPRYEHYTPLTPNRTTILEEAFNVDVLMKLPSPLPPRPRLDKTKYCRYDCSYDHNTKDCWALKDKIKELMWAGYIA